MPVTHCLPAGTPWNANQASRPPVNSGTTTISDAVGARRGRLIFFPSTGALSTQINDTTGAAAGLAAWTTNMNNDGWQVVGVNNALNDGGAPQFQLDVISDVANGSRYYQTSLHYWDHIITWCNKNAPGGAMPAGAAGFSFGAWNTVIVALNRTTAVAGIPYSNCIGYISRSLATQFNAGPVGALFNTPPNNFLPAGWTANTSGINLTPLPVLSLTGCSVTGGVLTCTVSSLAGSGIATNTWVTVNGSTGGTVDGSHQVTGTSGGTTATMATAASNGNYLGTPTLMNANTLLNTLATPGLLFYGNTSELVLWQELSTIGSTAAQVPNTALTNTLMSGEGHTWLSADTTTATNWVTSVLDPLYPKNF